MIIRLNEEQLAFEQRIDEVEMSSDFVMLANQVEAVYEEIGATVMRCIPKAGEDPIQLFVPKERRIYPDYPA